jgi:hypothetical protein
MDLVKSGLAITTPSLALSDDALLVSELMPRLMLFRIGQPDNDAVLIQQFNSFNNSTFDIFFLHCYL